MNSLTQVLYENSKLSKSVKIDDVVNKFNEYIKEYEIKYGISRVKENYAYKKTLKYIYNNFRR